VADLIIGASIEDLKQTSRAISYLDSARRDNTTRQRRALFDLRLASFVRESARLYRLGNRFQIRHLSAARSLALSWAWVAMSDFQSDLSAVEFAFIEELAT
jgi:hypothetical protein